MESGIAALERDALCHALTRVVSERGWTGASPAGVAREAGIAPERFYDHFRSLEHCFHSRLCEVIQPKGEGIHLNSLSKVIHDRLACKNIGGSSKSSV